MEDEKSAFEESRFRDEAALVRRGYPKVAVSPEVYDYGYEENYGHDRKAKEFNLRDIWRKVRKHKGLIVSITIIITTLTAIEMYRRKPIYRASTMIEIAREQYGPIKAADAVVEDTETTGPNGSLKTKIYIIQSDPLLEGVVKELKLPENPKFWSSTRRSVEEAVKTILGQNVDGEPMRNQLPAAEAAKAPSTDEATRHQEESEMLERYVSKIRNGLNVEQIKETQILSITYTDTDPTIAASVANGVAKAFIDRNFENKTAKFTKASDWLDRSTRELQAQVEQAERALANYTRDHNIFSTDGKATLTTDKLTRLHDQALRAQIDKMLKQSLYEQVKNGGDLSRLPESFADPALTELNKKQAELVVLANQLSLTYGPQNPRLLEVKQQLLSVQEQIDKSRNALGEKLSAEYERAERDDRSLTAALEQAKSEASQQNQHAIEYSILRQNVDTTKAIYTDFLQRNSQAKIQVAEQNNNVRVIQPAKQPKGPIGGGRMTMILAAFLASLCGSVGLALLIEYFDKSIKTIEDVVRYTQLPALGIIPMVPRLLSQRMRQDDRGLRAKSNRKTIALEENSKFDKSKLIVLDERSAAAEAYRGLRTSVLLSTAEKPPKTILVVSGRSGEGKTTTVVNTAISLAQLGASVLIIDGDLRKPSVHKILGVNQTAGLSNFLSRDMFLHELIAPTAIPNLFLLPCGQIPPNPAELISSKRMKEMLKTLSERFDHILIDSPPITNVTDPIILSTLVDGVILVVHGGKTSREDVRRSCQELTSVGAKNFGVVLNNIDLQKEGYKDAYFRYYYASQGGDSMAPAPPFR
jgi:polysaccharide biosynthesis transport protein